MLHYIKFHFLAPEGDESEEEEYDDDKQSQEAYASDNQWSDSEDDEIGEMRKSKEYDNEDAKSRFSQYSMSSSVMRRNQGLSLLDDKFEKVFFL